MGESIEINRVRRLVVAGTMVVGLAVGAGTASAQDQHSGGETPTTAKVDPGAEVLGNTQSRGGGALPLTGGDIAGLVAVGLGAAAVGSAAVVGSRRRASNAPA
ncbi:MAG: LPXTG cell wall anchor domain-containing protein [Microthrixaceae bacterium]